MAIAGRVGQAKVRGAWLWTVIAGRVGQAKVRGVALNGDCREGGTG